MKKTLLIYHLLFFCCVMSQATSYAQSVDEAYLNSEINERKINQEDWALIIEGINYSEKIEEEDDEDNEDVNTSPTGSGNNRGGSSRAYPSGGGSGISGFSGFFKVLIILIIVIALVVLTMQFMGAGSFNRPQNRKTAENDNTDIDLENIEDYIYESDLDRFIRQAVEKKNYALAIRLYYLAIIKELSLNKIIRWKKDKTNKDYIREMRKTNSFQAFREATRVFERVWYGESELKEIDYNKIKPQFDALIKAAQSRTIKIT